MSHPAKIIPLSNVETTTVTQTEFKITRDQLLHLLRENDVRVPCTADVYIVVPGGGDWSYERLDINSDHPIIIRWETTERS